VCIGAGLFLACDSLGHLPLFYVFLYFLSTSCAVVNNIYFSPFKKKTKF
jgi:hypothetical protein